MLFQYPQFPILSAPQDGDFAENVVDQLKLDNLEKMQTAGFDKSELPVQPWSGWYWPLKDGGLAFRYADPSFPTDQSWEKIFAYFKATLGKVPVSQLSPSEKYDLLVGDTKFSLTRRMLMTARNHSINGEIEPWIGFCNGWAAAAVALPRPKHSVSAMAMDGKTLIEFHPSDLKALGTLLWATGFFQTRSAGSLCRESSIERNPENYRSSTQSCFDTNPATFHLAIVNQIAIARRAMIIDTEPGLQIWNHPVHRYSYRYFNPSTDEFDTLERSKINLIDFKNDRFSSTRTVETKYVVGVEMNVTFIFHSKPSVAFVDGEESDEKRFPIYRYDLELDESGKIVGGEWHSRIHPDVIWIIEQNALPVTYGDHLLKESTSSWKQNIPIPHDWREAATESTKYGQPLGRIVETLFSWSSK